NFNADGTYTTAMIHNQWDCQTIASPQNVGNGVEYGIFTWNQATGAIQLPAKAVIDTNGGCGFSDPGGENFGGSVTRVGNTIEIRESPGGPLIATAPAVESVPDTLVGGWVREAGNGTLLVFHADGTFLYVDPQSANLDPNNLYGQERGCYSTSGGSVTFTIDAACEPDGLASYDLNSAGGFLSVPAVTSLTVPYTVTGDTLAFNGSTITFKRTHPN
ncbi:MAG TPA: hypothetical protein VFO94_09575, partial [Gammaproteobacteria bacterium]|nr:hypothetical protein [Gammaproteobacteria bacterium]